MACTVMAISGRKTLPTEGMVPQIRERAAIFAVHGSRAVIDLCFVAEGTSGRIFARRLAAMPFSTYRMIGFRPVREP
jgi:hypothetical protein